MIAAVLGSAPCMRDDIEALPVEPDLWVVVNDVGVYWPTVDAWVTLHPESMERWEAERRANGHPDGYTTYARREPHLVHELVQPYGGGSVSMYGVRIAEHRGATHTILCGCPMDISGHDEASTEDHTFAEHLEKYRRAWERKLRRPEKPAGRYLTHHTRSMSGWTREILGAPTTEWLED